MVNVFDDDFSPEAAERSRQQTIAPAAPAAAPNNVFDNDFAPPQTPAMPQAIGPEISTYEDVKRTLPAAAQRGVIGAPGIFGNISELGARGIGVAVSGVESGLRSLGFNINSDNARRQAMLETGGGKIFPTSQDLISAAEPYTGKLYEPQTTTGKIVGAGVEALPTAVIPGGQAGIGARALSAFGSGAGGEAVGEALKGTYLETPGRILGSIGGSIAAPKVITPYTNMNNAERAAQVRMLQREDVPLTAGQRLGNPALQKLEEKAATRTGGIGAAERINERQASEFDRAVTDYAVPRSGPGAVTGNAPTPRVLNEGQAALSDEYNRIFNNRTMQYDHALGQALDAAVKKAGGSLPTANRADMKKLSDVRADIANTVVQNQGKITGRQYQDFRSDLRTMASDAYRTGNSTLGDGAKAMQRALDAHFQKSLPPQLAADLNLNNLRYANLKSVISASGKSSGEHITPQNLVAAQKVGRAAQFAKGGLPLDEFADAARTVMKPLPAAKDAFWPSVGRGLRSVIPGSSAGVLGFLGAGPVGAAVAGGTGAVASALKNRAVLSAPGQAYLGNQIAPISAREAMARSLLEQAMRGR